jgi:hypothetical protein
MVTFYLSVSKMHHVGLDNDDISHPINYAPFAACAWVISLYLIEIY